MVKDVGGYKVTGYVNAGVFYGAGFCDIFLFKQPGGYVYDFVVRYQETVLKRDG